MNDPFRVALTFDAEHADRHLVASDPGDQLLDLLGEAGLRATFFIQSRWASANPDLARRIADEGHLIGNHSASHARLTRLSDAGLRDDVGEAGSDVARITGADPRPWFRCPFGDGSDDPRVLGVLRQLGYRNVHWHVEPEDWEPSHSSTDVERAVVDGVLEHGDGAVVLMHSWPAATRGAVPVAVARLAEAGASFVTVDELEALP